MRTPLILSSAFIALLMSSTAHAQDHAAAKAPTIDTLAIETVTSGNMGAPWTPGAVKVDGATGVLSGRQYFTPTPAGDVMVSTASGPVKLNSLSQADLVKMLALTDESVRIEQLDASGNVTSVVVGASVNKGYYRITYTFYRYLNVPCAAGTPGSGGIAIGVGMQVSAVVKSTKTNVSVGGPIPLAFAANLNRVSGSLHIQVAGMASGTGSIQSFLASSGTSLDPEGIRKAVESLGVVKAVFETPSVTLAPHFLYVESDDIGKCLADFRPGNGG